MKRFWRRSLILLLIFLLLLVGMVYSLRLRPVQAFVVRKTEAWLAEKLRTRVQLGRVEVVWPNSMLLENILLLDQASDTLVSLRAASVIGDFSGLLNQNIAVRNVTIEGCTVHIYQDSGGFNFDFIEKAFPSSGSKEPSAFVINAAGAHLQLHKVAFRYSNAVDTSAFDLWASHFFGQVEEVNLQKEGYALANLQLTGTTMMYAKGKNQQSDTRFNPNQIEIEDLVLDARDLAWTKANGLRFELLDGCFQSPEVVRVSQISGKYAQQTNTHQVSDLVLVLPKSHVIGNASFTDAAEQNSDGFQAEILSGRVSMTDARAFVEMGNLPKNEAQIIDIKGLVNGRQTDLYFRDLRVGTVAETKVRLSGTVRQYQNLERFSADIDVQEAHVLVADARHWLKDSLPELLHATDRFDLSAKLKGNAAQLGFQARAQMAQGFENLNLRANGFLTNLTKPKALTYQISVDTLTASAAAIQRFLPPDALPKDQTLPETMSLEGEVFGSLDTAHFQLHLLAQRKAQESEAMVAGQVHFSEGKPQLQLSISNALLSKTEITQWLPDSVKAILNLPERLALVGQFAQEGNTMRAKIELADNSIGVLQVSVNQQDGQSHVHLTSQKLQLNQLLSEHFFTMTGLDAKQVLNLEAEGKLDSFGRYDLQLDIDNIAFGKLNPPHAASGMGQWSEDDDIIQHDASVDQIIQGAAQWTEDDDIAQFDSKDKPARTESLASAHTVLQHISLNTRGNLNAQDLRNSRLKFTVQTQQQLEGKSIEIKSVVDILLDSANYTAQPRLTGVASLTDSRVRTPRLETDLASGFEETTFSAFHSVFPAALNAQFHMQGNVNDSMHVQSDWLKASAYGPLTNEHLARDLVQWLSTYFRVNQKPVIATSSQANLAIDATMHPRFVLPKQALPDGMILPTDLVLHADIKLHNNTGELKLNVRDFSVNHQNVQSIELKAQADGTQLNYQGFANLPTGDLPLAVDSLALSGVFANDTAQVQLTMLDSLDVKHGQLQTMLLAQGNAVKIHLMPEQLIGDQKWTAKSGNTILIDEGGGITCSDLQLTSDNQSLTVSGDTRDTLFVLSENLDLQKLSALVPNQELPIGGFMQANLAIQLPKDGSQLASGRLQIDSLSYQSILLGKLNAEIENADGITGVKGTLKQTNGQASLDAKLFPENRLRGQLALQDFEMQALQPFLSETVSQMSGTANGQIELNGTLDQPKASGAIMLKGLCMTPLANHVRYCNTLDTLFLTPNAITLRNWKVNDKRGGSIKLDGEVVLNDWKDVQLKLAFDGNNVMLLNEAVNVSTDQAYQGEVFADASGTISGPITLPVVNTSIKTTQASEVKYRFESVSRNTDWAEGIIQFREDETLKNETKSKEKAESSAYKLNLAFEDKDLLRLKAVLNPVTGDHFEALGSGALQVEMSSDGNLQMTGQYMLSDGFYQYHLHRYLSRRFEILKGSQIQWTGNPEQPELAITAQYVVKAMPPLSLLSNENAITERQTILLNIHITGYLDKPEIGFSISYPTDQKYGNSANTDFASYIESLNRDPAQVTNEMFTLLTLGRFTGSDDLNLSLGTTFSANAFLANQLNQLTQDIKVVDIQFNSVENGQGGSDLGFSVSRSMLNNRLVLRVSSTPFKENGSGMVQNFTGEYALTPNGTWKLRAFGVPEQSQFFESTQILKSGGGLLFTRSFQRFGKRRKR